MKYHIVDKAAFRIIGIRRGICCVNGQNLIEIPKLWAEANQDGTLSKLVQLQNGNIPGVLGVCIDQRSSEAAEADMDYWIGVTADIDAPEDLRTLVVPAHTWAVFEVHGPMPQAIQEIWGKINAEWFGASGFAHAEGPELEVYPDERDPASADYYSEIWIPVTRMLTP